MFLSSIYITIILISLFIFIFISRRRNLKLLIANILSLITTIVLIAVPLFNEILKSLAIRFASDFAPLISSRIKDINISQTFMYINTLFFIYICNLIGFYLLAKIFIRNKSYFRDFDNKVLKVNLKVTFASLNTMCVLFVGALILVNLNTYFKLELGIFDNVFSLAEKVINYL